METLQEFEELIKSISGDNMLFEREGETQQWEYRFRPPANGPEGLAAWFRVFPLRPAKEPATPTSIVSSVAVSVARNQSRKEATSLGHFGRSYDDLSALLESCFGAECGKFQITCKNKQLLTAFLGTIITWRRERMLVNG